MRKKPLREGKFSTFYALSRWPDISGIWKIGEISGPIITSADVTLNGGLIRELPQNPLNSGLGIILICPEIWLHSPQAYWKYYQNQWWFVVFHACMSSKMDRERNITTLSCGLKNAPLTLFKLYVPQEHALVKKGPSWTSQLWKKPSSFKQNFVPKDPLRWHTPFSVVKNRISHPWFGRFFFWSKGSEQRVGVLKHVATSFQGWEDLELFFSWRTRCLTRLSWFQQLKFC